MRRHALTLFGLGCATSQPDRAWEIPVESEAPEVTIVFPNDGSVWSSGEVLTIHARIFDPDDPLECLTVRLQIDQAESLDWTMTENGAWQSTIWMTPGPHEIVLKAIDPHGVAGRAELTVEGTSSLDTGHQDTGPPAR